MALDTELALIALVVGGVLLAMHPSIAPDSNGLSIGSEPFPTVSCLSPFNRITGEQQFNQFRKLHQSPPPSVLLVARAAEAMCSNATNGREHIVDALGIGAVVLVGLSFLRRRRPVVIVPVNPSVL